jgi:hypothetical protein
MVERLYKKGLVVGIIVLFIAVSVAPSINANVSRIPNKSKLVETSIRIHKSNGIIPFTIKLTEEGSDEIEKIFDNLKVSLDSAFSDEDIDKIYNDAVESLFAVDMFPKMTIGEAKQLVNSKSVKSRSGDLEGDENFNCRVIGWVTNTNMFDINRLFLNIFLENIRFLTLFYFGRFYNFRYYDGKIGSIAFGSAEYGGMGPDYSPAKGWVWTNGSNGIVKWNGSFYGKDVEEIIWEPNLRWGVCAFGGVSNFNGLWITGHVKPVYFIGNAEHVKITYEPPPTPV